MQHGMGSCSQGACDHSDPSLPPAIAQEFPCSSPLAGRGRASVTCWPWMALGDVPALPGVQEVSVVCADMLKHTCLCFLRQMHGSGTATSKARLRKEQAALHETGCVGLLYWLKMAPVLSINLPLDLHLCAKELLFVLCVSITSLVILLLVHSLRTCSH